MYKLFGPVNLGPSCHDKVIKNLVKKEKRRQMTTLQLIASENFTSQEIMDVTGSVLTNKYSEGYPGKRYYGGNVHVDEIENIAIERVKSLFGAEHANVQPHSGSQANMAVYNALLKPGDVVLSMSLSEGGHLSHGSPVSASGQFYNFVHYGLDTDELINYDEIKELANIHNPKMIIAGASSYSRSIDPKKFREICDETNSYFMFDAAHIAGLIAGGQHLNPVPYADVVTFTTHKTLRGPRGGCILSTKEHAKKIDSGLFPGNQGGPLDHAIAAKAVAFHNALDPSFTEYAETIIENAKTLASELQSYGFRLVSGGTDNHLVLIDLRSFDKDLNGKMAQEILDQGNVSLNRNAVPNDTRSKFVTSGIRIGVGSVTTQGMGTYEMKKIARFIYLILKNREYPYIIQEISEKVKDLCIKFPPY
tara:strand:- start:20791 stop:22050 length:1260 start_codon:yes stop_codon:yes gene_type:complete